MDGDEVENEGESKNANKHVDEKKPPVITRSPPCAPFNQLQALTPSTTKSRNKWAEGVEHTRLVISLYRKQIRGGRVFLHEHPRNATSWVLEEVQKLS